MVDFSALIQRIEAAVYENGVQAITGQILQDCLKDVVNTVNVQKQDAIYRITVTVDGTTGTPSGTARMDDETYTLELSFSGLKGETGPAGPRGLQGEKGDTGERGATGATGATGAQGPRGPVGPQGLQGIPGTAGRDGVDGVGVTDVVQTVISDEPYGQNVVTITLSNGTSKSFVIKNGGNGPAGPRGPKGDTGETGPQGPQGPQGPAAEVNEEDLDFNAQNKLQLADRVYNSSTPDGLGYVILRKNKTFAEQVTATNTIYEIRYDFDLRGDEVTIPAGCELRFIGGRIGGEGKIVGTGTFINSEGTCFGENVALSGTWANEIVYTKWLSFISSEDGVTDNSLCFKQLQAIINGTKGCRVEFVPGTYQTQIIGMEPEGYVEKDGVTYPKWAMNTYQVDARVVLNIFELKRLEIDMRGATIKAIGITCPGWNMIRLNGVQDSSIHDGTLIGMADGFDYPDYVNYADTVTNDYEFSTLLYQAGGSCQIQNMTCEYSTGDGIAVGSDSWYFRTGDVRPTGVVQANGVVRFPAEGYNVIGCEVSYCGRNGITLHSSEQGELADCHIHHIGSDAGSGNIGSDGIQGRAPRAGIDVEFEDGQGLMPIMRWEGLYIHDCGGKSFGFASVSQSKMRQFSARNCRFIRLGVNNNLNAEGPKEFVNCYFEHNGGEGSLLGAGSTFRDCQFILKTYDFRIGAQTFENCVITDEYAEEDNSHYMFSQNHNKAIFRNCILTIRHPYGYLQDKTFYDCVLNLYAKKIIYACGIEFYNCEFHKDPDDDTAYSFCFTAGNDPNLTRGHFWFVGCTFDTLRGTGNSVSEFAFSTTYPIVIDGCKFTDRLSFYAGSYCSDITIRDSTFSVLNVSRYDDAGDNVKPVLIDGCVVDSLNIGNAGTRAVEVKDSKIEIAAGGTYKLQKVHFTRCEVTNYDARPNYYPDVDVTAVDSILNFVVATSTSAFDLTKCYVKGLVTEASFQGTKKDCTFETSFPKSGATADRPSASAVGAGFTYFDTDLGKMVVSNGTDWVNMDGSPISTAYAKYVVCADEAAYNNIQNKDSGTLYLIPE